MIVRLLNVNVTSLLLLLLLPSGTFGSLITGFDQTIVASGLGGPMGRGDGPSSMAVTPDGRTLIATVTGEVKVVQNGSLVPTSALSLNVLTGAGTDRGLQGIALDPNFSSNGFVYLYFSSPDANGTTFHDILARFTMAGNTINPASETILKQLPVEDDSVSVFHLGGGLAFGKDGKIYLGVGDQYLPTALGTDVSQDLGSDFGKILRLNPDGSTPSDNPFVSTPGALGDIYAYGFRNPFTLEVNNTTGQILVNDVGEGTWEEVNALTAGANYGWDLAEGPSNNLLFTNPLYYYPHDYSQPVCSGAIVGGAFSSALGGGFAPNSFYFADYCAGWIDSVNLTGAPTGSPLATDLGPIVALAPAPNGGLYYLSQSNGGELGLISPVPEPANAGPIAFTLLLTWAATRLIRRYTPPGTHSC